MEVEKLIRECPNDECEHCNQSSKMCYSCGWIESRHRYEPVQLEVLGDRAIKDKLYQIQLEGFDWSENITDAEMIKFKAISQATITHNKAKFGNLFCVGLWRGVNEDISNQVRTSPRPGSFA